MKDLITRKKEAEERTISYNKLTTKEKLLKLDLQVGDKGSPKQRTRLTTLLAQELATGTIPAGVGDSIQKPVKKPYQKPKRS